MKREYLLPAWEMSYRMLGIDRTGEGPLVPVAVFAIALDTPDNDWPKLLSNFVKPTIGDRDYWLNTKSFLDTKLLKSRGHSDEEIQDLEFQLTELGYQIYYKHRKR